MKENIFMSGYTKMYGHNRRAAVLGIVNENKTEVEVGIAVCSEKDQFSRKEARRIINERLKSNKGFVIRGDFKDEKTARMGVYAIFETLKGKPEQFFKPYNNRKVKDKLRAQKRS